MLHTCGKEYEPHLRAITGQVRKHVEYLIQQQLLGGLHIVIDILEHKEHRHARVFLKVSFDGVYHFKLVELGLGCHGLLVLLEPKGFS